MTVLHAVKSDSIRIMPYNDGYLAGTLEVAEAIHAASVYADMPLDRLKLLQRLGAAGSLAGDQFFRLAVRGEEVLGGLYGFAAKAFFCDVLVAKDLGWWVREEARGGRAAILLLQAFEDWARKIGARKIGLGQTGVADIDRTRRLYEHCGYTIVGYNAMKDL